MDRDDPMGVVPPNTPASSAANTPRFQENLPTPRALEAILTPVQAVGAEQSAASLAISAEGPAVLAKR
eukprot:683740-Alexandrium_andersonii.AAC.1